MIQIKMQTLVVLLFLTTIIDSVKIGISKPVIVSENVTIEVTTLDPTTTTVKISTTSSVTKTTTAKTIQTTKPTQATTSTTTTPIPPTTTTTTTTTVTPPSANNDSQPSPIRTKNTDRKGYFCSCDLRPNFCDINCCCDIDCILEELNSFDCHQEDNRLEDFNYLQGLPPCKINEGWLCVFRTNIDISRNKHQNYFLDISSFHEWPQLLIEDTNDLARDRSYYKIGQPILLYNFEVNEIIKFDLPFNLLGHQCQINESVRYLQSKKTSCHLALEKAKTLETALFQKLCTSFLLQGPNIQIPLDGIIKETFTKFIPITLFRCTNINDCFPVSINNSFFEYLDDAAYSKLIQTKLTHNITTLISCEVYFVQSDETSNEVWLSYEVNFVHINETQGIALNVSGPLGYNVGSPLIIGHKVLLNESGEHVDSNRILSYFHPNRTQNIHIFVPKKRQGQCENSQLTVNFGESILVQCSIELDNSTEITSETNFTKICGDLQDRSIEIFQIKKILKLEEDDFFISILGYPANKTESWKKIKLRNYEHLPVLGMYVEKEDSFVCQNMILGMKYEFLIVKEDVNGVRHQNILHQATIEMGKRHDLQFQLDEAVSIPITFSTMFYDLQVVVNEASAQWPSLYISVFLSLLVLMYVP